MAGRQSSEGVPQPVADERLHELQQVLKAVPTAILRFDRDGRIVYANERVQDHLGIDPEEATSRTYNDAAWELRALDGTPIPDDELPFAVLMETGEPVDGYRHRVGHPDGSDSVIEVSGVPLRAETGDIEGCVFSIRDVTDQYARERTIRQLQETTRRLLETSDPEAAAIVALQGIESVLEYSLAGIWLASDDGTRLEPVAMSEHSETVIDSQPTYTADGDSLSWEAFASGTARRIDDMTEESGRANAETPIRSELIVPIGEFGMVNVGATERAAFDDDDLRRVELWSTTVESALARLAQIDCLQEREAALTRERDRLDDFASIIAHDLRNLVNVADGHLGVARSREDFDRLDPVERALDRMDDIMDDTLTLARQGETVDDAEPVAVERLAADCLDVIDAADATVTVAEAFAVVADGDRLAHVFENLFRNSVDHGDAEVAVTVGRTDGGFYVEDDGPGVPPEDRETVFESGFTTREEGTGLGLRIVDQIVAAHGWEITVSEGTAGGARFEITGVEFADASDADDTSDANASR